MQISKRQYKFALQQVGVLRDGNLEMLNLMFDAPRCEVTAPQLARLMGYRSFQAANALVGYLGKRIAKALKIRLRPRPNNSSGAWNVIAHGEQRRSGFTWCLRDELCEALDELGMLIDDPDAALPGELTMTEDLWEGAVRSVRVNVFERNRVARRVCLEHYGAACHVCGFDFAEEFGDLGRDYIHVHHLVEISTISSEYRVNPISDLRPVCPNCHTMLHRRKPSLTIEELQAIRRKTSQNAQRTR